MEYNQAVNRTLALDVLKQRGCTLRYAFKKIRKYLGEFIH
jgi:hypothetical protein